LRRKPPFRRPGWLDHERRGVERLFPYSRTRFTDMLSRSSRSFTRALQTTMLPISQNAFVPSYVSGQTVTSTLPVWSSISAARNVRPSLVLRSRDYCTTPPIITSRPDISAVSSMIPHVRYVRSSSAARANGCSER
jgi:hypothetical protein